MRVRFYRMSNRAMIVTFMCALSYARHVAQYYAKGNSKARCDIHAIRVTKRGDQWYTVSAAGSYTLSMFNIVQENNPGLNLLFKTLKTYPIMRRH